MRGHARTCAHMHAHARTCVHMRTHACTCALMRAHARTCTHMRAHRPPPWVAAHAAAGTPPRRARMQAHAVHACTPHAFLGRGAAGTGSKPLRQRLMSNPCGSRARNRRIRGPTPSPLGQGAFALHSASGWFGCAACSSPRGAPRSQQGKGGYLASWCNCKHFGTCTHAQARTQGACKRTV